MDTESKDLLREWLVRSLEPVCDADPEVLSKYVLALIQHDPEKEGLRDTCITKLEEFLGDETTPFVDRLFQALKTGSYRRDDREEDDNRHRQLHRHGHGDDSDDASRRRGRANSDDDDERRRIQKRRRDDDYGGGRRPPYSPSRRGESGRLRESGPGGRNGSGGRGHWERGGPPPSMDGRRFPPPPEWGMPPGPPMGMWGPPPHYPPGGGAGFPPHPGMPEFDPNGPPPYEGGGMMMPPPHQMMMMPRHMGGRGYYPYGGRGGGRGGRGGGFHGGRSSGNAPGDESGAVEASTNGAPTSGARTTLRVSNVDPKYVNMTKLSLHFSKFGNVVNVQMRPNHRCAYVQYATEEEAKKAFHSPIPVCNNRFIEVKWAKYDAKDPHGAPSEEAEDTKSAEDSETASGGETSGATPSVAPMTATTESTTDAEAEKTMTPEELRAAALEKGRKVLEDKRELLEKQRQLMKQKEELLKRQLAQQKELLERISQNPTSVSVADKRELLNKIMALSEELKALQPPRRDSGDSNKLSGLKAELSALEAQAAGGSVPGPVGGRGPMVGGRWGAPNGSGRGYYRGGVGGRGGGRGGYHRGPFAHHSNTLDNRTTIVKVENLPESARDASVLEQHFGTFGVVERVVLDESASDRGFIKFQDRYGGQAALTRGAQYGESRLTLSWVEVQDAPPALSQGGVEVASATNDGAETTEASA